MSRAVAAARLLAERHRERAEPRPEASLLNYAERPRAGDWSLRSALVRLAQPEPVRAAAVLELVRRCDGALHPFGRALERATVTCDRALLLDALAAGGGDDAPPPPAEPYPDTRMADLARLVRDTDTAGAADEIVTSYVDATDGDVAVGDEELEALPLLAVALELDSLAEALTAWADRGPRDPPLDVVDTTCRRVNARLDQAGVPHETGPPGPRGQSRG